MIKCDVIKDLLPLYADEVTSEGSRALVEEHIKDCENCKNELAEIKQGVKLRIETPKENILKKFKHKIFLRNVLVGAVASILTICILLIGGQYFFLHDTPIKYYDDLVIVQKNYADSLRNGENITDGVMSVPVIDLACMQPYFTCYGTERTIDRNGEKIKVYYISYTETMASQYSFIKRNTGELFRIAQPQLDDTTNKIEIYYTDELSPRAISTSTRDIDFDAYRQDCTLIWSGTLG